MSLEEMKDRLEFLKKYMKSKGEEVQTLTGSLLDITTKLEIVKYEMEWALKEMDELEKNIADLEKQENGNANP